MEDSVKERDNADEILSGGNKKPSKSHEVSEGHNKGFVHKVRGNPWMLSTLILAVVLIIFLVAGSGSGAISGKTSKDVVAQNVMSILSLTAPGEVSLDSVSEESGLYKINVLYQGDVAPIYATQDGKLMITGVIPLEEYGNNANGGEDSITGNVVAGVSVDDDPVIGSPDAPVTIIEFSDFQCPFCERFYTQTLPLIEENYVKTGKVKIVFRDFPLNSIHPQAQKASEAAECAYELGGNDAFWKYHNKLFENQDALDVASLKKYAVEIGLDANKFNSCLDSGKKASEVAKDLADGEKAGVTGTPAFFINGRLVEGAQPYANFQKVIDEELAKAGA